MGVSINLLDTPFIVVVAVLSNYPSLIIFSNSSI